MIRKLVDFALSNRFVVLAAAALLLAWGALSFHNLPVEAYPDIADNYVTVITQWPGRAAEEVEQQVTIPIEIQMSGIPHLTHLRSESIFGLSFVIMIFDDDSENDWNRQRVLERLSQVDLPDGLSPSMGTDWSTVGQIYWYTLRSTNPKVDIMELKALQDWTLTKAFKSVPDVVDVSTFGGATREYQVRIDPNKLISYGLTIGQVEQQLGANNVNAGGSFIEQGLQQMNVRTIGLMTSVSGHREHRPQDANRDAAAGEGHRRGRAGGEDPPRADRQGDSPRRTARSSTTTTSSTRSSTAQRRRCRHRRWTRFTRRRRS